MRNPKQDGSNVYDCVPQTGKCPVKCNQCYFNRGYYRETPFVDDDVPEDGIVRMNCGHDSNIDRKAVLEAAKKYKHVFFNTSIPKFLFPGPVVFTANAKEEEQPWLPNSCEGWEHNLMAVRLRVSMYNLDYVREAIEKWTKYVPVIMTFMAYYDQEPFLPGAYEWKVRHINSYWCVTHETILLVMQPYVDNDRVLLCDGLCRHCGNCEKVYEAWMK